MEYYVTFADGSSAYLEHFGVKGMHWGVWNAETRARRMGGGTGAKRKGSSGESSSTSSSGRHLTDKQKKMLKGAAIGIGTAAAIGGGVYLARTGKLKQLNNAKNIAINKAKAEHEDRVKRVRNDLRGKMYDARLETAENPFSKGPNSWLNYRTHVEEARREHTRHKLGKDEWANRPALRTYINSSIAVGRTLTNSRAMMNGKINVANKSYKKGKRAVDALTAAGGILAVGAGTGAGVGYYKKSTSKTKRSSAKKRK